MKVQRLSWAGLKINTGDICILIDPVENFANVKNFVLDIPEATLRFSQDTQADYILLTHLHLDHYDAPLIRQILKPGGKLIASVMVADKLREDGFEVTALQLEETYDAGAAQFTPVYAMDGVGDKQVSWIVTDDTHRILHGGDTMWHNQFWHIAEEYAPFDAVFLPVNGVKVFFRKFFTPVPITLTPVQAVSAAYILKAGALVPIHYGFTQQGVYEEFPDVKNALKSASEEMNIPVKLLQAGEALELETTGVIG